MGEKSKTPKPEEGPDAEFIKNLEATGIPVEQIPEEDLAEIETKETKNPEKIAEARREFDAVFSEGGPELSKETENDESEQYLKASQELEQLRELKRLMEERAQLLYQYQQADRITSRAIRIDSNDPNKDKKLGQLRTAQDIVKQYKDIQDRIEDIEEKLKK